MIDERNKPKLSAFLKLWEPKHLKNPNRKIFQFWKPKYIKNSNYNPKEMIDINIIKGERRNKCQKNS